MIVAKLFAEVMLYARNLFFASTTGKNGTYHLEVKIYVHMPSGVTKGVASNKWTLTIVRYFLGVVKHMVESQYECR